MDYQSFIYTVIISLLTGALSILGVVLTLRQNNKQMQAQLDEKCEDKQQQIIENRPEFEIIEYKTFFEEHGYFEDKSFDMDILMRFEKVDPKKYLQRDEWTRVEYTFNNIGKGTIGYINFIAFNRDLFLFNLCKMKSNNIEDTIFDTHKNIMYYNKKIHQNDIFKIRLWYHKDGIIEGFTSNATGIGFKSFDKRYWIQNLNAPRNILEESVLQKNESSYNRIISGRE